MALQQSQQKRQVAYKVRIKNIIQGQYVKDDVEPSYVISDNQKISRVNILATIVAKSNFCLLGGFSPANLDTPPYDNTEA